MITDKSVEVTYRDRTGQSKQIEMVLTAKQIEATFIRRMQTLVPQSQIISINEIQQTELTTVAGTTERTKK